MSRCTRPNTPRLILNHGEFSADVAPQTHRGRCPHRPIVPLIEIRTSPCLTRLLRIGLFKSNSQFDEVALVAISLHILDRHNQGRRYSCHGRLAPHRSELARVIDYFGSRKRFPLLRNDPHLRLLVAGPHFHDAPIFLRCSSTRAASVSTSSVSFGSGVA